MKEEEWDAFFREPEGYWDMEEPAPGHRERFARRLAGWSPEQSGEKDPGGAGSGLGPWLRLQYLGLAAAAVVAIVLGTWVFTPKEGPTARQVSEISPEAGRSAYYFAGIVEEQIRELEAASTPQTAPLVRATLDQIRTLEEDYVRLEEELVRGGNTALLLKAMITNFQTRIDLLTDVLVQIEEFNLLNAQQHENLDI